VAGVGILHPSIAGAFSLPELHGGGDIAHGELMRYFAEAGLSQAGSVFAHSPSHMEPRFHTTSASGVAGERKHGVRLGSTHQHHAVATPTNCSTSNVGQCG
jgi:hypothetical protein